MDGLGTSVAATNLLSLLLSLLPPPPPLLLLLPPLLLLLLGAVDPGESPDSSCRMKTGKLL
jgi:hypothetical protein